MSKDRRWIWQSSNYPHFAYDLTKLNSLLQSLSLKQGELIALSKVIDSKNLNKTLLKALEEEVLSSAFIEGEVLDKKSVKSSIREKLGLEKIDYYKDKTKESNFVDILFEANKNYATKLTEQKILKWHYKLFEKHNTKLWNINVGAFRTSGTMQIVSGVIGKERVFYEAPPSQVVKSEIEKFLEWFNKTEPSLIKAAIAHLWFVIIHPFDDGNGRIARAISEKALSQIEKPKLTRLYSISKAIKEDKKNYYKALEKTTGYIKKDNPLDITFWCEWFLKALKKAIEEAIRNIEFIIHKTKFWDKYEGKLNTRQTKVINLMLDKELQSISTKIYTKIAQTSPATASRDIKELLHLGCIKQVEGTAGRNVRYICTTVV